MDEYTIKGLKTWTGRQGVAASGTLMLGRVEVAAFRDEANGGCMIIRPLDRPAYDAWAALVAAADLRWPADMGGKTVDFEREDFAINRMVDAELERRTLARWCKTYLVFRLDGDAAGSFRKLTVPAGRTAAEAAAFVRGRYEREGRIVEILNDRFSAPATPARKTRKATTAASAGG
jgi:hypothetical protein